MLDLINQVKKLIVISEIEGGTCLDDWIIDGDISDMTAQDIATEWDELSKKETDENAPY